MEKTFRICWGLVALSFAIAFVIYLKWDGSDVPVHFDANGKPDRYGSALLGILMPPLLFLFIQTTTIFAVKSEPAQKNLEHSKKLIQASMIGVGLIIIVIQLVSMATMFKIIPCVAVLFRYVPVLAGLALIVVGNYLPKTRRNFSAGIKNRWTLASDEVWQKTHRFAAPLFIIAGLVMALSPFVFSFQVTRIVTTTVILAAISTAIGYSYWAWVKAGKPSAIS
jgi:uncharacterized membrane protein